jgi:hypothetical protein
MLPPNIKYFKESEFDQQNLPNSGHNMCPFTVELFDILRETAGFPLQVISGYRTPAYNAEVSKTGSTGAHTLGKAADFKVNDNYDLYKLAKLAIPMGFTGLGFRNNSLHLDTCTTDDDGLSRPAFWTYAGQTVLVPNKVALTFIAHKEAWDMFAGLLKRPDPISIYILQHGDARARYIATTPAENHGLFVAHG